MGQGLGHSCHLLTLTGATGHAGTGYPRNGANSCDKDQIVAWRRLAASENRTWHSRYRGIVSLTQNVEEASVGRRIDA